MAWIKMIADDQAEGKLARIFTAAKKRAGRVANILRVQSTNPFALQASMALYVASTLDEESPLTRAQREMLALVVSRANNCHY